MSQPTDRMVWQWGPRRSTRASAENPCAITRPLSGVGGNTRRRQKGLENFVRQQPPAACEADAIALLQQQPLAGQFRDRGLNIADRMRTKLFGNPAQIHATAQPQAQEECFFESGSARD